MSILKILVYILFFFILHIFTIFSDLKAYEKESDKNKIFKKVDIIKSISIDGLNYTDDSVVERELTGKAGETFESDNWTNEKNRFDSLGIFADSSLNIREGQDGLNLEYSFKELPPFIPFVAMKVTDQNGLIAGPAVAFLNLFGQAIRLEGYYRLALYPEFNQAREYMLYLSSEWINNIPVEYEIFAVYNDLYNPLKCFNEKSMLFSIDSAYRLKQLKILITGEIFRIRHDYENEIFTAGGEDTNLFLTESSSELIPKLGAGLIWDTRDRLINTHNGIYNEARISGYGGWLGGPAKYIEYLYDFRGYYTFFNKHVLHLSMLAQYRPGKMGAYDYFHVGGTNTLRSFGQDPEHYGQHEFLGTVEYRYELYGRRRFKLMGMNLFIGLQLVIGIDNATLWKEDDALSHGKSFQALYSGLHILFPGFNRMRLEFGMHEDEDIPGKMQYGFTFGFWEKSTVQRWQTR